MLVFRICDELLQIIQGRRIDKIEKQSVYVSG